MNGTQLTETLYNCSITSDAGKDLESVLGKINTQTCNTYDTDCLVTKNNFVILTDLNDFNSPTSYSSLYFQEKYYLISTSNEFSSIYWAQTFYLHQKNVTTESVNAEIFESMLSKVLIPAYVCLGGEQAIFAAWPGATKSLGFQSEQQLLSF